MLKLLDTPKSKITFIQKVIKGETWLVMAQSAVEIEDEFSSLYFTATVPSNLFLQPPFDPKVLLNLTQTNNVLNQCIEAMEVNIDGTGHEFVPAEEGKEINKEEEKRALAFFKEPYPNLSMVAIRRKLRRQMEGIGYGFIEVLRNMNEDVVGLRNTETSQIRLVKLDFPVQVKKKVEREGKEVEMTLWERERRFGQRIALKTLVYYREFGTSRHINRMTGEWESKEKPIKPEDRGTELLVFGIHPDINSPYFVPRWINQLPSVIGSRNAEEQNLEFLDAGGLPPAIIFVQGGTLIKDTSDQLKSYLSGQNKNKNRACVVEVQSSSGSLDASGKVDVKTERFGSAQSQDSMYTNYDAVTEEHVRVGFRLPPLFLGKAADYNFATAQTAYMIAEAQVFLPERTEFDELVNKTLMKELGFKSLKIKSKPITLKDVATQIKGLELSKDVATRDSFMTEMNTIAGMALKMAEVPSTNVAPDQEKPLTPTMDDTESKDLPAHINQIDAPPKAEPTLADKAKEADVMGKIQAKHSPTLKDKVKEVDAIEKVKAKYKKTAVELIDLAHDYAVLKRLVRKGDLTPERALVVEEAVQTLSHEEAQAFNSLIATYAFGDDEPELVDLVARSY